MEGEVISSFLIYFILSQNNQVNGGKYEDNQHKPDRDRSGEIDVLYKVNKLQRRNKAGGIKQRETTFINNRRRNIREEQIAKNSGNNNHHGSKRKNILKKMQKQRNFLRKTQKPTKNILVGDHCNWLDFDTAQSRGVSCRDGAKMVIKNK